MTPNPDSEREEAEMAAALEEVGVPACYAPQVIAASRQLDVCPGCGRIMSRREAAEQGACNDCNGGAW
jgi:hypothetical protein